MYSSSKRLAALERGLTPTIQRSTYGGLVTLIEAGTLDMSQLTDTELWWLCVGRAEPMPTDAELDRRLEEIHAQA
jgi:hypothetical protein